MDNDEIEFLGTSYRNILKGISLVPTSPGYPTLTFDLPASKSTLSIEVGRLSSTSPKDSNPECALYRCPVVSRRHAKLVLNGHQATIQDLSSHHGTVLTRNQDDPHVLTPAATPTVLTNGDLVTFGKAVSDSLNGGHVLPVSVHIKFHYVSQSRFGLSCLTDSDSDSEHSNSRASSMDISSHSSPRHSPEPIETNLFPLMTHQISPDFDEPEVDFPFPPNQLGLASSSNLSRMFDSHSGERSASLHMQQLARDSLHSIPESTSQSSDATQRSQRSFDAVIDNIFGPSPPILGSQTSDELENHNATLSFPRRESPPLPEGLQEQVITSQAPLDLDPKTPMRRPESRGREQSPLLPPSPRIMDQDPAEALTSIAPVVESGGIRAFFKALGVVRTPDSSPPAASQIDQPMMESISAEQSRPVIDKDQVVSELKEFIQERVTVHVNGAFQDIQERISASMEEMSEHKLEILDEMNRELDEFKGPASSPIIRDILRTEIMSNINVENVVRDIVTDDHVVNIKGIINAAIQDALGQAKMEIKDSLKTSIAADMRMEVDAVRGEMNRSIQAAQDNFHGQLGELEPRVLSIFRDSIAKEADNLEARDGNMRDQLSAMTKEIEESKLLVEQLRQQLEAEKANWSHQQVAEKRKLEEDNESIIVKRNRPDDSSSLASLKAALRTTVRSTLVATVGGLGVWFSLAYL